MAVRIQYLPVCEVILYQVRQYSFRQLQYFRFFDRLD